MAELQANSKTVQEFLLQCGRARMISEVSSFGAQSKIFSQLKKDNPELVSIDGVIKTGSVTIYELKGF